MKSVSFKCQSHDSQVLLTSFPSCRVHAAGGLSHGSPVALASESSPSHPNCEAFSLPSNRTTPNNVKNDGLRNLGKEFEDARIVKAYLEDYPGGLTVCEFISKVINPGHDKGRMFLKYRPRFTEVSNTSKKAVCKVCGRKENKYKI